MRKQFILGVGCQKGGTTWLHNQLIKSSEVNLGFVKDGNSTINNNTIGI